jgi:hypothetical protein
MWRNSRHNGLKIEVLPVSPPFIAHPNRERLNLAALRDWLATEVIETSSPFIDLDQRLAVMPDYLDFVPPDRSVHDLTFY